jgi:cytochrome P450
MTANPSSDVYYDPYDVGINADPHPTFRRLRNEAPIYYNERHDLWALSRHADVEKALVDWETFSNSRSDILDLIKAAKAGAITLPTGVVLFEDPPLHTMHRGLMSRVFTPRRMNALEGLVRDFCAKCLDPFVGREKFDFAVHLGAEMPMKVIGMLLGIPDSAQPAVRENTDAVLRTEPGKPMNVKQESIEYVEWRARHPSDDLMTVLLNAEFEDETGALRKLSRTEVLTYTQVLAGAGNETTGRLIGWLGKILGERPDQRRELAQNPGLIPNAVEETLRFEPTGPALARYVMRDVEFYGRTVPEGSAMMLLVASAARDERRYEDPDRFDIHRQDVQHLIFGRGVHFCLGASLARLEARVALEEVLKRFPDWEIDYENLRMAPTSATMRGWESMPVFLR